jgi:DNA polymerase III epsilon subunit-like protein
MPGSELHRLAFIDTETTGLDRLTRAVWEFAAIVRELDGREWSTSFMIRLSDDEIRNANPSALKINRFHDRYIGAAPHKTPKATAAEIIYNTIGLPEHRTVLIGAVPSFDEYSLWNLVNQRDTPRWHHRITDVEAMARTVLGWPAARGNLGELATALGVPFDPTERHGALADATLARDIYDYCRNWTIVPLKGRVEA